MKKKLVVLLVIVVLLVLLIPIPIHLKDGGTVEYRALIYKISNVHRLYEDLGYEQGIIIELLGIEVYNSVNIDKNVNEDYESKVDNDMEIIKNINVIIDGKKYNVNIEDNETAKTFVSILPQEFNMNELNGNEKYFYMNESLQANPSNPKYIEKGDVMLYGENCLVIFYKSFNTSYSYTKIGHIDNLPNLGNGSITAKFEKN